MMTRYFIQSLMMTLLASILVTENAHAQSAFYKIKIGQLEVFALLDGTVPLDAEKLFGENEPGMVKGLLQSAYLNNPTETSINAFLVVNGDRLILVDAGSGELFGPNHGGRLVYSLQAAGYQPAQITDILLTHIHNDHSGGLSIKDQAVFPKAIVHVSKADADYWLDEKRMAQASPTALSSNKSSFVNAIKVFKPYLASGRVKTFEGDVALFPGIRAVAAAGHTPGHTIYVLENNGDKLIFCGDLVHVGGVQFADPSLVDGFDVDKPKAIAQRVKIYQEAAQQGLLLAADHVSYPGIGRLRAKGKGYEWLPVPYSLEGRTK